MRKQGFTTYSCNWLFILLLTYCLTACVRQDKNDCVQRSLSIKVIDEDGNDITSSGSVETIDAYLFDKSGFIRMISIGSFELSLLGSEAEKDYTIVAWGNLKGDTLSSPRLTPTMSMQESLFRLIRKEDGYHLPVTDLFYCRKEINNDALSRSIINETLTLTLARATASISICARHLSQRFGVSESDYQLTVHGISDAINFLGQPVGDEALFKPNSEMNEKGELYASPFHIFPTSDARAIKIDIVRDGQVLFTATTDKEGKPLLAPIGRLLNVEIDFLEGEQAEITVSVFPWEEEIEQDTEM